MIIVAGAGPAGLAAALGARRAGHEVTVVEAAGFVGGMTASYEVAGQSVDHGSHRLHPAMSPAVEQLVRPLLGDDLQTRTRHGRVRIAERWLGFPLRTSELVRGLPRRVAARMALDAIAAPVRRPRSDTFAEFVRAGLGPTVLDEFYGPYARKLWGRPPEDLAAEIARRRISIGSPLAMARRLARSGSAGRQFLYPRRGFGQIAERLADAAVAEGVDLRLGSPLGAVRSGAHGVEVEVGATTVSGSALLSTLPLVVLLRSLGAEPEPVEYRGLVLAQLVVDGDRWTEYDAHYLPGPDTLASRVSEPKNYRESSDDPTEVSALCAEIPTSPGDRWWDASPEVVAERLLDDFGRLGLPVPSVAEVVLRRIDRVYPVYGPGEDPLGRAEGMLDGFANVVSFGRGGRINADNTHHAIDMGLGAASCLDRHGKVDEVAWHRRRQDFAGHVVED